MTHRLLASAGLLMLAACARPSADARRDIVSLSPAVTRALLDLGQSDRLAGVTAFDPCCPPGCVRLGEAGHVDLEVVLALKPRWVLTQVSDGLPADSGLRQAAAHGRFQWVAWPTATSISAALDLPRQVGATLGVSGDAAALHAEDQWRRLKSRARPPRRVLLVTGMAPEVGALGPGFIHDELLCGMGGVNALPAGAPGWVQMDAEAIRACHAEVIVWLAPGRTQAEAADASIFAASGARVAVVTDPWALVPASNIPVLAAELAAAIWPEFPSQEQP